MPNSRTAPYNATVTPCIADALVELNLCAFGSKTVNDDKVVVIFDEKQFAELRSRIYTDSTFIAVRYDKLGQVDGYELYIDTYVSEVRARSQNQEHP